MVKAVQELESGIDAETVARNHGISKATLYNWKATKGEAYTMSTLFFL